MKKIKIIALLFVSLLVVQSCTKKETIIEEYTPPSATIYGTWLLTNPNPANLTKTYIIFNANEDFYYSIQEDQYGFRSSSNSTFNATNKQLNLGGSLFNYTTIGDTLKLFQNSLNTQFYVKVKTPTMTFNNWTSNASISRSVMAPSGISSSRSFGFNGDFLYFYSSTFGKRVYKYNTLNNSFVDSMLVGYSCSNFYKNGNTYFGFTGNYGLGKTTELVAGSYSTISTNTLASVYAISNNGSSNTFYAYLSNDQLYAGSDGGAFTLIKDLSQYNTNSVVYYNNDEFLTLKNGEIHKIKISPNFTATKSYNPIPNYSLYTLSTNGVDVWAYAYNYNLGKYEYIKLNLN